MDASFWIARAACGDALWAPYRGTDLPVKVLLDKRGRLLRTADVKSFGLSFLRSSSARWATSRACRRSSDDAPDKEGLLAGCARNGSIGE
jgi:hypothetical protein